MATIFVAYGSEPNRERVLEFAAERASASGDDLLVYHITESDDDSNEKVRDEIEAVIQRTAPTVEYTVAIGPRHQLSERDAEYERSMVSAQKQLVDTITSSDRDIEYVVMGNVDRGPVEEFTLASMTEAVLETREVPVVLVPTTTD